MFGKLVNVCPVSSQQKKRIILTAGFFTFLLVCCLGHAYATTYYVDNCVVTGNDTNDGTSPSAPWLTVAKVNSSTFSAGDSILFQRGCTWREQLKPPSSGSAGSPITFSAYGSGAQPILNGTQVVSSTGWSLYSGSIYFALLSSPPNLVFQDGTRSLSLATSTASMTAGSFYYEPSTSRLYVWTSDSANPSAHMIEVSVNPANYYGLVFVTTNYIKLDNLHITKSNYFGVEIYNAGNLTVQNCTFDYGYQNDVTPAEGSFTYDTVNILNNTFSNGGIARTRSSGIGSAAEGVPINIFGFQNSIIRGNNILNTTAGPDPIHTAEGITVTANAVNVEISYNRVANTGNGIYVSAGYGNDKDTLNTIVKYNYVYKSATHNYEIALEGSGASIDGVEFFGNVGDTCPGDNLLFGYNNTGGVIKNAHVYNNTFYGCKIGVEAYGPTTDSSNLFENNIFYASDVAFALADPNEANYSPDYNLLYVTGDANTSIKWEGVYYSLPNFQSVKSKMLKSTSADPMFISTSAPNLSLQPASPAIDAGAKLGSNYEYDLASSSSWPLSVTTLNQNNYGTGWDIGAYVFDTSVSNAPAPPTSLVAVPH